MARRKPAVTKPKTVRVVRRSLDATSIAKVTALGTVGYLSGVMLQKLLKKDQWYIPVIAGLAMASGGKKILGPLAFPLAAGMTIAGGSQLLQGIPAIKGMFSGYLPGEWGEQLPGLRNPLLADYFPGGHLPISNAHLNFQKFNNVVSD